MFRQYVKPVYVKDDSGRLVPYKGEAMKKTIVVGYLSLIVGPVTVFAESSPCLNNT